MKVVNKTIESELIIEKSRFITNVFRLYAKEDASTYINMIKKKYWDASHNCYAYQFNSDIAKSSDDGEPSGTAGIPILEVLKKQSITNTLIIVTRYFGGIKLGVGGLIRAYANCASLALKEASFVKIVTLDRYFLTIPYRYLDQVTSAIKEGSILHTTFSEEIELEFAYDKQEILNLEVKLSNILNKRISLMSVGTLDVDVPASDI